MTNEDKNFCAETPAPCSRKPAITDEMVEAARFTLTGICGFEITAQAVRKALESAILAATAAEDGR